MLGTAPKYGEYSAMLIHVGGQNNASHEEIAQFDKDFQNHATLMDKPI